MKRVIQQLWGDKEERPKKVTVGTVQRLLGIPSKRLQNCPMCTQEIEKYQESQDTIQRNGDTLNWTHIGKLTNMRKRDLIDCMPYLRDYEGEYTSIVESVI